MTSWPGCVRSSTEGWRAMLADHQREAASRLVAMLRARGGAILADDVGLGKSFVAAAVARELGWEVRMIVPATLVAQWRETLDAFRIEACILTHDALARHPFVPDPARPRLVIVDEAHAFRNPRTRRYDALARHAVGARLLFVTATPVCNAVADLEALLALIADDDALLDCGVASIDLAFTRRDREALEVMVRELVVRRERDVLPPALRFGALRRRVLRPPLFAATAIDALQFPLVGSAPLLRRFLWRRLESSEAALLESIRRQLRFYDRALDCLASGRTLTKRDYRRAFAGEEDREAFQQVLFWDLWAASGIAADARQVEEEVARLQELREQVARSPCTKRTMLLDLVAKEPEPLLLFTGSAATARDLFDTLRDRVRCGLVTARERNRKAAIEAFRRGGTDVLICTDLAAEGLNLQRAGVVVHYDIPWNPVKLDQRNGRAHRIGQARDAVRAVYFLPERDPTRVIKTVAAKNRIRRRALRPALTPPTAPPAAPPPGPSGSANVLRPRVARDAAVVRLFAALEKQGLATPELLARRHRAGIERLLGEMSREYLDAGRLEELLALVRLTRPENASGAAVHSR
ncbi:MAG: helicase domain protein [Acidobacteria bacterium]|nr:helicase domain protein [Acidobacteriota bacterium]